MLAGWLLYRVASPIWWLTLALIGWSLAQCAPAADFDLVGHIVPEVVASVSLHGATAPFESATLSDERGRFRFRKLAPGAYTLAVFQPARGVRAPGSQRHPTCVAT